MQFVNLTDEQRKQIAAEQASKNIQPMPMEKGLQTEILPFSLNPLKLFGGVASNAAADAAGADRDYRADISNARSTDEIKSAVNNAISKFDNANPLIFGGDDLKKQKSEFLKNVSNSIRQSKLADGLSEYNGNLYLRKGDELFDLDDGLIKQIGRVMRDNVGSMAGAALGYKKGGGFLQNMAGSALGAAGGSSIDHLNNSNYAGQEANAANALKKMGEEALFSVAGDTLIGAAAKYGKPALNIAGKVVDKMPLLNLGKQAIEGVPTANVKGAMKSAEAIAGDEAEAMLKNAAEVGGYKVDGGNITDLQLLNPIINKAKEISAKTAQKLHLDGAAAAINNTRGLDAEREKILSLALSDRKSAERLLNALRGDKSGRGARNLADLAQSDVSRIREMIGQSEQTDIKDAVEQYYKDTKANFGQAIDNLDAFKNGQKIKLSDDAIERMKEEYSSNLNIFDKSSDKTHGVMDGFDSLKGRELGVKELNELRANYNKGLNEILNSDKNSYATKINFAKGKEILEQAMDDLLGDDVARAYLRENLQKYKDFKGFERSPLFKAITNIESSAQDVMNAFRGLRDAQGGLYDKFISKLSPEQAQKFELAAIKDDFEGALGKTGTFNVREILNGKELNDALKKTNFRSEKAKEIVREIDKLAKARGNLAEIFAALDSKFIMPTRFNKGIATTFGGASKTAFVNAVRQTALKYVPIIGNDAALEYHLREAAKAIKTGGTLNDYAKTMEKNGASKEQAKAFTDFIKEAAEQGSKLEQAEAKQGNKTVVRGNNIQIIENLDEAEIRDIVTNKKRVAVDMLDKETADKMGFKYPDVKRTIYADEITHTLKQHGNEAKEAARGQKAITAKDIANYHKFAKDADKNIIVDGERGQKVLISGKQINGHYVVVEEAQTKNNNLAFKTMYFRKGNVNDNKVFQSAPMAKDSQGLAFSPYKDDAQRVAQTNDSIIPQNSADRLVEKIIELDDAEKIGNMLRKTIISKDISTKTKLAAINAAKRRLVAITAKNTQKDDKKQK